jgi:hypothetical protein
VDYRREHSQNGGFPRAINTKQTKYFARFGGERDILDGQHSALTIHKLLGELFCNYHPWSKFKLVLEILGKDASSARANSLSVDYCKHQDRYSSNRNDRYEEGHEVQYRPNQLEKQEQSQHGPK